MYYKKQLNLLNNKAIVRFFVQNNILFDNAKIRQEFEKETIHFVKIKIILTIYVKKIFNYFK